MKFITANKDWVINFENVEPDWLSIVAVGGNADIPLDMFDCNCKIENFDGKEVFFAMFYYRIKNSPICKIDYTFSTK